MRFESLFLHQWTSLNRLDAGPVFSEIRRKAALFSRVDRSLTAKLPGLNGIGSLRAVALSNETNAATLDAAQGSKCANRRRLACDFDDVDVLSSCL
jgi:hypothetical protein